ncbi:MAG: aromatic ring-hydroxylating oxygenase subunit alpha [Actinomycetes bacterium]
MFSQAEVMALRGRPAPFADGELADSLAPLGSSRMLPRQAYADPVVFAWEQANFFSGWVCTGRATDDLVEPGSRRAVGIGGSTVLLVRGEDGLLRAFANVCRHRGHELLPCGGSARKRAIVCPYHGWSYRLDGSLLNAPGFRDVEGFAPEGLGLVEMPLAEWHSWVFVDPSREAGAFAAHVGALEDIVKPYAPESLTVTTTHEYEVAANWKVIVENYQECYHCTLIHPELCQVSPPDSGETLDLPGDWVGGWMDLKPAVETMSLDGRSQGATIATLDDHGKAAVMYASVFPNLLVSLHPDYVMTHRLTPLAPDATRIECAWLFPAEVAAADGFDPAYAVDFWDLTNRQDWAACESVQRGFGSPLQVSGPLAPAEDGVQHFVSRIARGYLLQP